MKTIRLTMAQALVKFLDNQYVEFDGVQHKFVKGIFTVFGHGNVLGLGQALEQDPGELVVHQARNEQGMSHVAAGYAKQKLRKQIYACTSSVGPGAANMVTAAATATANRIPVLFLPGDTYASRQPDPVLQQIEHFHDISISTNDAFKAVSKYWDRINRPEQLMSAMLNAMRVLTDPADTGAVTIALPQDVQAEAYDYPVEFFKKRVHRIERRPPTKEMINDAVNLIRTKKKPILICGGGVRYSEASETFRAFAEKYNIPFGETQAGKSAIPWDHELNLGGIGATGNLAANMIAREADLVIGVGTRYTDFTTSSKWLFQNENVEFVNINVAEFDAYKLDAVKVVADAKVALEALMQELDKVGYKSAYTNEIKEAKDKWAEELKRLDTLQYTGKGFKPEIAGHIDHVLEEFGEATGSYLTQTRVLGILNEILDNDAIVVGSSGSLPGDMQRVWRAKAPETYHMEYGYSCMGYEINAALGAKLACPDKEVYAMVGDGSYMMLHSELPTSIQERKKINVVVFDNMSFGCINNLQMGHGMGSFGTEFRYRNPETGKLDGDLIYIDFAKNAEGYGCKTYTVRTEEELRAAVEDAKKQTVSTLIDIKVLPKTMTHDYESWWRVGSAEVAEKESVLSATRRVKKELEKARKY
ncbi:3D-(3,5/4)-trihydroxycyclohexane-1,2-dione acylhydrolase (decyclizing) [Clostridium thermosuccinogenes]|uniref:3D-(3,5/4)-trihydroxycyclohexane-1,2-dione hydrolase n=1 Tax=Clostridium thermosuccinogenes TaxID=84032 RepID=A0A2K2FKT2_9CLOT|nr:3D-(3,5/4)-trihydroxycyclohexane-1,2-dione acylhydrolase (decyclizing) [Pseudoclostridium thermosuccinogenes]AUS96008.1 3D-(3,5/4)-trihydroxycyclohexane-1,2-dione acylhydrolase (decyclizing) [Pseudoclostridium thermosuccinogenes]PNT99397.1 3D-(3,5/4)-trihydroxycyclohexane-1,2-dione acylhydrolase (decyclizing) [Pseudoclostridium thermosuccinogenes]PNU01084.1 3D-(3,5/4)-trihydroxycyclohexane-1,2-dione acylhydrolase (decyclizing) [Pseudoclostridium thermosuccinogenes]